MPFATNAVTLPGTVSRSERWAMAIEWHMACNMFGFRTFMLNLSKLMAIVIIIILEFAQSQLSLHFASIPRFGYWSTKIWRLVYLDLASILMRFGFWSAKTW